MTESNNEATPAPDSRPAARSGPDPVSEVLTTDCTALWIACGTLFHTGVTTGIGVLAGPDRAAGTEDKGGPELIRIGVRRESGKNRGYAEIRSPQGRRAAMVDLDVERGAGNADSGPVWIEASFGIIKAAAANAGGRLEIRTAPIPPDDGDRHACRLLLQGPGFFAEAPGRIGGGDNAWNSAAYTGGGWIEAPAAALQPQFRAAAGMDADGWIEIPPDGGIRFNADPGEIPDWIGYEARIPGTAAAAAGMKGPVHVPDRIIRALAEYEVTGILAGGGLSKKGERLWISNSPDGNGGEALFTGRTSRPRLRWRGYRASKPPKPNAGPGGGMRTESINIGVNRLAHAAQYEAAAAAAEGLRGGYETLTIDLAEGTAAGRRIKADIRGDAPRTAGKAAQGRIKVRPKHLPMMDKAADCRLTVHFPADAEPGSRVLIEISRKSETGLESAARLVGEAAA